MSDLGYFDLGGTYRAKTPAETLQTILPLLKRFDITRVANITGLDNVGIPVFLTIRPSAKHISVSLGKGMTPELAKISGIMESIELWHAENIPQYNLISGSYNELSQQYNVIDPSQVAYSIYQKEALKDWLLSWCQADELMTQQKILIPFDAISLDSTTLRKSSLLFQTSSNGLASGNSRDEALCHAIYEIIERDAYHYFSLQSATEKQARLIDNSTVTGSLVLEIMQRFQKASLTVKIFNITSKLGVPAFLCLLSDQSFTRNTQVFSGKGCHFNKEVALLRALTEAAQTRLTFIAGSRDDAFPSYYKKIVLDHNRDIIGSADYQQIQQPNYSNQFVDNVSSLLELLKQHGCRKVILFDHTPECTDIAVVRVLIPGLMMAVEL